jgi:hypothetical protein
MEVLRRTSMNAIPLPGLVLVAWLAAPTAFASCSAPEGITDLPKGASASREEMLAAQRAIKSYDTAVRAYVDCLGQAGESSLKGEALLDQLQKTVERFNRELRAFKEKNGAS